MSVKTYRGVLLAAAAVAAAVLQPSGHPASAAQSAQSLHERAKRAGGRLVELYEPERRAVYHDLKQLAGDSDAIVVGQVLSHRPRLSPDGQRVMKDARVRVQGVVKGGVRPGAALRVRLAGGGYAFPDGTFAYAGPKDFRPAEERRLYVFFLRAAGAGYEPVSETQALYALADGKVEPAHTSPRGPLVRKYRGADPAAFLKELREVVKVGGR